MIGKRYNLAAAPSMRKTQLERIVTLYLVENQVFDKAVLKLIPTAEEKIRLETEKTNIKISQATSTEEVMEMTDEYIGAIAMFINSSTNFPPQLVSPNSVEVRITSNILMPPKSQESHERNTKPKVDAKTSETNVEIYPGIVTEMKNDSCLE